MLRVGLYLLFIPVCWKQCERTRQQRGTFINEGDFSDVILRVLGFTWNFRGSGH